MTQPYDETFVGDTSQASDDYQSFCGSGAGGSSSGADLVYMFSTTQTGTLQLTLTAQGGSFDPVMYLRTTCDDDGSTVWCRDLGDSQESFKQHLTPGTYYVFVDGADGSSGAYSLRVQFSAAQCGDGVTNPNNSEQCDDGNNQTGDGCDACSIEANAFEDCSSPQFRSILPGSRTLSGSNLGNADDHTFPGTVCGTQDFGGGPDQVWALVPQASGTLRLRLGFVEDLSASACVADPSGPYCFDRVLHVRHADGDASESACANIANHLTCDGPGAPHTQDVSFAVTAGETYFVFIDSHWNGGGTPAYVSGPYYLHVDLT
ncbi:MAG: DUF4215 domain-containing protein [Deltaproteobacteria bacterium]|nr:DUF4215 domain-containing protein [Deltaproteobacteria bacterium]MBW2535404.1 DUF4215 domain-containing protein [Deltaproteobacteria bacterium]